jgi:hypothetical protein
MKDLENLTNETFDNLLEKYVKNTETYNHFEFGTELAREATGFGTVYELLEITNLNDYTGFEPEDSEMDMDYNFDGFLVEETKDKYVRDLNDGLSTVYLQGLPYFEEFYYDFLNVTGYEGTKEDFEQGLRRSVDFFNFLVDITTSE